MKISILVIFLLCTSQLLAQPQCLSQIFNVSSNAKMNNDFRINDIIIVGEMHGVFGTNEIKLEIIKQLNQERNFRNIFMEISKSAAFLYNLFLSTGDTTLLSNPTLPYYIKNEEKKLWSDLYKYNFGLPGSSKFRIYGVDFERIEFLKVLKLLLPKDKNPDNSIFTQTLYKEYDSLIENVNDYKVFNKLFSRYKKYFSKNIEELKTIYGTNFYLVESIFSNKSSQKRFNHRNETMYGNIKEAVQKNSITKFLGFFGLNHTNSEKSYTLVGRLINDNSLNRVLNISMICKDGYDWQQYIKTFEYAGPYTYYRDKNLMDSIFANFYLKDCKYTIVETKTINNEKVSSFSNYLILMKDQPEFN